MALPHLHVVDLLVRVTILLLQIKAHVQTETVEEVVVAEVVAAVNIIIIRELGHPNKKRMFFLDGEEVDDHCMLSGDNMQNFIIIRQNSFNYVTIYCHLRSSVFFLVQSDRVKALGTEVEE